MDLYVYFIKKQKKYFIYCRYITYIMQLFVTLSANIFTF